MMEASGTEFQQNVCNSSLDTCRSHSQPFVNSALTEISVAKIETIKPTYIENLAYGNLSNVAIGVEPDIR